MKTMTIAQANAIIKENNVNKEIHWAVTYNDNDGMRIENDYAGGVAYKFEVHENKDIEVYNCDSESTIAYLIHGHEFYCDFENMEVGFSMAIKKIMKHFYYFY